MGVDSARALWASFCFRLATPQRACGSRWWSGSSIQASASSGSHCTILRMVYVTFKFVLNILSCLRSKGQVQTDVPLAALTCLLCPIHVPHALYMFPTPHYTCSPCHIMFLSPLHVPPALNMFPQPSTCSLSSVDVLSALIMFPQPSTCSLRSIMFPQVYNVPSALNMFSQLYTCSLSPQLQLYTCSFSPQHVPSAFNMFPQLSTYSLSPQHVLSALYMFLQLYTCSLSSAHIPSVLNMFPQQNVTSALSMFPQPYTYPPAHNMFPHPSTCSLCPQYVPPALSKFL